MEQCDHLAERERLTRRLKHAKEGQAAKQAERAAWLKQQLREARAGADRRAGELYAARLSNARARETKAEALQQKQARQLARAEAAEEALSAARQADDELCEQLEAVKAPTTPLTAALSRRSVRGRFQAEAWQARVLKWAQLARRVPRVAVGANINDVLRVYAPE